MNRLSPPPVLRRTSGAMTTDIDLAATTPLIGTDLGAIGLTHMTAATLATHTLATKTEKDRTRRKERLTTKRKAEARDGADLGLEVECVSCVV